MKFSKKNFCQIGQIQRLMSRRTKGAISSFVQSGNYESLTLTEFEPATLRVAVRHTT